MDPSSYRPISLTAVACKVLERVVVDQMRHYLKSSSLLCNEQHGFVPNKSTVTNLLQCDTIIANYLNERKACDVFMLDFKRAFDQVFHAIQISKLWSLSFSSTLRSWLLDFLSNRSQFVSYAYAVSAPVNVTSGVIQGSVMGSLLFIIMINDLPENLTTMRMVLYADDRKAIEEANSCDDCCRNQHDLDAIYSWSIANRLPLSLPKCQCIHFGNNNTHHMYTMGGTAIASVDQCTDLGVVRSCDFKYALHISTTISKASRKWSMIRRVFSTRNHTFLKKLYMAYVRLILDYASVIWNPSAVGLEDDIKRIQRRFSNSINLLTSVWYDERLNFLGMETLKARRRHADLRFTYKVVYKIINIEPESVGLVRSQAPTRSHGTGLVVHLARNNTAGSSYKFRICKV